MGASASMQTIIQNTVNTTVNSINNIAQGSATANCIVNIGSIGWTNVNNCQITVLNNCSASAVATVDAVTAAVTQVYNSLDAPQRNQGAQLFTVSTNVQTSVQTLVNDFATYVNNTCKTDALLNNVITVQNFNLGSCNSNTLVNFTFVNTGQASGNCALNVVNNVLTNAVNSVTASQVNENANLYIILGLVAIAGLFALVIIVYILKGIFIMSPKDKIRLALAKKDKPDIFTRYAYNFDDRAVLKANSEVMDSQFANTFNRVADAAISKIEKIK